MIQFPARAKCGIHIKALTLTQRVAYTAFTERFLYSSLGNSNKLRLQS